MQWCAVAISCYIVEYQWMLLLLCHIVDHTSMSYSGMQWMLLLLWNFMIVDDHRDGSDDSGDDNENDVNLFLYAKAR